MDCNGIIWITALHEMRLNRRAAGVKKSGNGADVTSGLRPLQWIYGEQQWRNG